MSLPISVRVLLRGDFGEPLAVACRQCGGFALNTDTGLCVPCTLAATPKTATQYYARLKGPDGHEVERAFPSMLERAIWMLEAMTLGCQIVAEGVR